MHRAGVLFSYCNLLRLREFRQLEQVSRKAALMQVVADPAGFDHATTSAMGHPPDTVHWLRRQPSGDVVTVPRSIDSWVGMLFVETRRVYASVFCSCALEVVVDVESEDECRLSVGRG